MLRVLLLQRSTRLANTKLVLRKDLQIRRRHTLGHSTAGMRVGHGVCVISVHLLRFAKNRRLLYVYVLLFTQPGDVPISAISVTHVLAMVLSR